MREALLLVGIGLVVGVPCALMTGRLASSQVSGLLFGLSATILRRWVVLRSC